jgi:2-oxoglutarate dehydrogenase E2 component (dihydrolipoamide succinyltransferase)
MIVIYVPPFGEANANASVRRWLKLEGDLVQAGEPVVELETNIAVFQIECEHDGVLQQIIRDPGEAVQEGDRLGIVTDSHALADSDAQHSQNRGQSVSEFLQSLEDEE